MCTNQYGGSGRTTVVEDPDDSYATSPDGGSVAGPDDYRLSRDAEGPL